MLSLVWVGHPGRLSSRSTSPVTCIGSILCPVQLGGLVERLVHMVILWWTPCSSCRAVHSASLNRIGCSHGSFGWLVIGLHGRWTSRSIMLMGVLGQQARLVGLDARTRGQAHSRTGHMASTSEHHHQQAYPGISGVSCVEWYGREV